MPPASASPPPSKLLPLGDYSGPDATDRQVVDELLAAFSSDGSPPQRHRGLLGRVQAIVFYILTVLFASASRQMGEGGGGGSACTSASQQTSADTDTD